MNLEQYILPFDLTDLKDGEDRVIQIRVKRDGPGIIFDIEQNLIPIYKNSIIVRGRNALTSNMIFNFLLKKKKRTSK